MRLSEMDNFIRKISLYGTSEEILAKATNDDETQELREELSCTSADILDALIVEARKIRGPESKIEPAP